MKMKMIISLVFSIAVLSRTVLCADVKCFAEKEVELSTKAYTIKSIADFCSQFEAFPSDALTISKECGFDKTNVTMLKTYVDEFCTQDSDLRQKFEKSKDCLTQNGMKTIECLKEMSPIGLDPEVKDPAKILKTLCKEKVFDKMFGCMNVKIGQPCGDEGLEVVKGFTDAYSFYIDSVCSQVNSSPSMTSLSWSILMALLAIYVVWK